MKQWLYALLMMAVILGSSSYAAPLTATTAAGSFSAVTTAEDPLQADSPDFLPVEQAFQVNALVDSQHLSLHWNIADGYYLYRKGFKLNSRSSATQLSAPEFADGILKWDQYFEEDLEVYYGQTSFKVPFTSDKPQFQLQLESQGCADAGLCYPPRKQVIDIDLDAGTAIVSEQDAVTQRVAASNISSMPLWLILLFAMAGGLILNLMPCVFPVLSIKVLSFTQQHQTTSERQRHGIAYATGVVISFVTIAAIMLALRAGGESIGWGFQLQSPGFVIFLVYLFILLGLSLSGYMQLFSGLMSLGQSSTTNNNGLSSSFMTGVLATTVASPCTAPFMGPALGFAIAQTNAVALLVFAFLGLGMALPFVLLTLTPSLIKKLPRPGQWMDNLKQFLAFPMYLTAIWLLWVVGRQTSVEIVIAICVGLMVMVMAIWLWQLAQRNRSQGLIKALAAGLFVAAIAYPNLKLETNDHKQWQDYSPQRLAALRQSGKAVFINLSADWCITCLVNERMAMGDDFYKALEDNNITYLKGDWTYKDPQITQLLNQYNRNGVPLYLVFPKGSGSAEILPQLLTKTSLLKALDRAN